jgi:hypothetical protein
LERQLTAYSSLKVTRVDANFKVVIALPRENFIILLGSFEPDSVSFHGPNEERRAINEIVHNILELWL